MQRGREVEADGEAKAEVVKKEIVSSTFTAGSRIVIITTNSKP